MQVRKPEVRQSILTAAENEFLDKGFEKASLRGIAGRAGVTKGNIYIYFKSKDQLFTTLTAPAMEFFERSMNEPLSDECMEKHYSSSAAVFPKHLNDTHAHFQTVLEHYTAFKLLFFHSAGSSVANCREDIIQMYSRQSRRCYALLGERRPEFKTDVSEMFLHALGACYVNAIEEIILHKPDRKEMQYFIEQITTFVHFGLEHMFKQQRLKTS